MDRQCRIRIRKTPALPILMNMLELHRYGKGTKNMQIVSATVRKRWVKGWRLCSNRPMVENGIEY